MSHSRVLVVEDEAVVSMEIAQRLEFMGYAVAGQAVTVAEALAMTEAQSPHLVLMDIRLSGELDGIDAAREIRRRFQLPVIFLTAYSESDTLERAKAAEPYGYLLKPFTDGELKSSIEIALHKHRADEEILRMNRLYDVLSQVNQAIVHNPSREELLAAVCRVIVERGRLDIAWIGRFDPICPPLEVVSYFGSGSYASSGSLSLANLNPETWQKTGALIQEGVPFVCSARGDHQCLYAPENVSSRSCFQSCASFLIRFQGQIWGMLSVATSKPDFLQEREVRLLEEVASDISFALDKIEGEVQRKRAEASLRENEERLRLFIDHAPASLAMFDRQMRYLSASRRWLSDYSLKDRDLTGLSHYEVLPEVPERWKEVHRRGLAGEVVRAEEDRFEREDGSEQWLRWEVRPWYASAGDVGGIVIFSEDITEQKQSESALGRSLARVRHLNDVLGAIREISGLLNRERDKQKLLTGVCECLVGTRGYVTVWIGQPDEASGELKPLAYVGPGAGYTSHAPIRWDDSALGQGPTGTALRERRPVVFNNLASDPRFAPWREPVLVTGAASIASVPLLHHERIFGVVTVRADQVDAFDAEEVALLSDLAKDVARALQVLEDQSERELTHAALRESEIKMRSIFRAAPIGIGLHSNRVILEVNERLCEIVGYPRYELIGMNGRMLYPTDDDYEYVGREKYRQIRERGTGTVETRFRCKDGKIVDVLLGSTPLDPTDLAAGVTFTVLDITDRKRAEESLRQAHSLLQNTFNAIPDLLTVHDRNLQVVFSNWHWRQYVSQEKRMSRPHCYACYMHKDQPCEPCPTLEVFRTGRGVVMEITNPHTQRVSEVSAYPVLGLSGEFDLVTMHVRDITERKLAEQEKKKLEEQLRQAQKLEAIGTLAGGIAHDFNNILSAIIGYTEMALEDTPEVSSQSSDLREVLKAAYRAKDLVSHILTFSRQGPAHELRPLAIGLIANEVLKLLRATLPSTIEIKSEISGEAGTVMGDPTQLHQIILNLCTNAAHAMREKGGILDVRLTTLDLDARTAKTYEGLEKGAYVRLIVRDNGHGMDLATQERIFDPYFTTKEVGDGTGLGLAVVHGIVKRHRGAIAVRSEPGKGTTFEVLFPGIEVANDVTTHIKSTVPKGTERILFVDDEEALADLGQRTLFQLGYQVIKSTSSTEALELFRSAPSAFDLVITDYTMPGMTGADLARGMRQIRQDIPIILCTGYSERMNEEKAEKMGIRAFVMKPIDRRTIAKAVRRVLDEKQPA